MNCLALRMKEGISSMHAIIIIDYTFENLSMIISTNLNLIISQDFWHLLKRKFH